MSYTTCSAKGTATAMTPSANADHQLLAV